MEGLFESQPWLLVPLIVVTIEGWSLTKALFRWWSRRGSHEEA